LGNFLNKFSHEAGGPPISLGEKKKISTLLGRRGLTTSSKQMGLVLEKHDCLGQMSPKHDSSKQMDSSSRGDTIAWGKWAQNMIPQGKWTQVLGETWFLDTNGSEFPQ